MKPETIYINYNHVNSVKYIDETRRIVFNFDYSVEIEANGERKLISDYTYFDYKTDEEYENAKEKYDRVLKTQQGFMRLTNNFYINFSKVSSIKAAMKNGKHRVIFNFSNPTSYRDEKNQKFITSDFMFLDFENEDEYTKFRTALGI